MKLLEEAFTPPPNYEEAETWLTNNQFIGKNALNEDGYPGRAVYAFEIPKTFKNLPEKYIQAIDKICDLIKNDEKSEPNLYFVISGIIFAYFRSIFFCSFLILNF